MANVHRSVSVPAPSSGEYTPEEQRHHLERSGSIIPAMWSLLRSARKSSAGLLEEKDTAEPVVDDSTNKALLQAQINGMVLVLILILGAILLAVYYVLEPFLHPLLWAILFGTFLHPFKHSSTSMIKEWLGYLESSGIPLSVGLCLSPAHLFNWLSENLEFLAISYWKHLLCSVGGVGGIWAMYSLNVPVYFYNAMVQVISAFQTIGSVMSHTGLLQMATLAVGFLVLFALSRHFNYPIATKILSTCMWFLAILNIAGYVLGGIALPVVVTVFVGAVIVGLLSKGCGDARSDQGSGEPLEVGITKEMVRSASDEYRGDEAITAVEKTRLERGGLARHLKGTDEPNSKRKGEKTQSNQIFLVLFVAVLIVTLWKYPLLLLLLSPLALWSILKYAISITAVQNSALCKIPELWASAKAWVFTRRNLFFPTPMPTLLRMYITLDRKVLGSVKRSVGSLMSCCIILGLLLSGLAVSILLVFQIQVELVHYVTMSANVWNRTVASSPQLQEWIGAAQGNESLQDTLGAYANQGYVQGRQWLASQVHSLVSDSSDNTSVVEQRVLDLFDELYQAYVLKNTSSLDLQIVLSQQKSSISSEEDDAMLWSELRVIVSENMETILTVLKSLWLIVTENLTVAFSFLYVLLELLFSGGTALLNSVVFMSALFYLLCYSEEDFLPVKWVMDLVQVLSQGVGDGNEYGKTFSRAIRSVFHASLRRAFFYGLYTWLIHSVFGLPVSVLPSVLAAIAGAIPFLGPYWVAVPAVLELWLVEGQLLVAMALLGLSLVPTFFVDTMIYGEIEGGGHPYLTGLAVAGGIYFAGLEGALFGPILLCCLLFVVDFFEGVH